MHLAQINTVLQIMLKLCLSIFYKRLRLMLFYKPFFIFNTLIYFSHFSFYIVYCFIYFLRFDTIICIRIFPAKH